MMHHVIYCLMVAFASKRILILDQAKEIFGFDDHFVPLSNCSLNSSMLETKSEWPKNDAEQVVRFCPNKKNNKNDYDLGRYKTSIFPYLPSQILTKLQVFNADPEVWFIGQYAKYVMRPQPWFLKEIIINQKRHSGGAAIQVRRQDKYRESKFIALEKYVEVLQDYFDILEAKNEVNYVSKNVFVATDEPEILTKLNSDFPKFNWKGDVDKARNSILQNRYTDEGQDAIIRDIFQLALSDFLVCTFSSNVCRLAYELHMALKPFVSHLYEIVTLDMDHFFQYGHEKHYLVIGNHANHSESDLIRVDTCFLGCKTPHDTGTNLRTNETGPFLRSKVKRIYLTSDTYV